MANGPNGNGNGNNGKKPRKPLSWRARLVSVWLAAILGGTAAAKIASKPFKVYIGNTPYEKYAKNEAAFRQHCQEGRVYGYRAKPGAPLGFTCAIPKHPNAPVGHLAKIGNQLAQNVEWCLTALFILILAAIVNTVIGIITRGAKARGALAESEMVVSTASLAVAVNNSQKSIVSELTKVIKNETKKVLIIQRTSQKLLDEWSELMESPAKTAQNIVKRNWKSTNLAVRRREVASELNAALADVETIVRAQLDVIRALPPGERAALQDAVRTGFASVNSRMNRILENSNRSGVGAAATAVVNSAKGVAVATAKKALTAAGNAATGGGATALRTAARAVGGARRLMLKAPNAASQSRQAGRPALHNRQASRSPSTSPRRNNNRTRLNAIRRRISANQTAGAAGPGLNGLIREERRLAAAVGSPTRYPSPPRVARRQASPPRAARRQASPPKAARRRSPSKSPNSRNANNALNNLLKQFK
jgi:hypothetical protein